MILSMTGHGQSQIQSGSHSVDCEIRAVNNRYLKCNISWHERFAKLESTVQSLIRKHARRGTFYISYKVGSLDGEAQYSLNERQLQSYRDQVEKFHPDFYAQLDGAAYLSLPGVIDELGKTGQLVDEIWDLMQKVTEEALARLIKMRSEEGATMARDLISNIESIEGNLDIISAKAPDVVTEYASRLHEKINKWLEPLESKITSSDIVREVGIFADRSDISEEIVRLRSHLDQFRANVDSSRGDGRKLEFVTQEMLRETNTIGSKANDSEIAHQVVDIKTAIERIREMVQNIE